MLQCRPVTVEIEIKSPEPVHANPAAVKPELTEKQKESMRRNEERKREEEQYKKDEDERKKKEAAAAASAVDPRSLAVTGDTVQKGASVEAQFANGEWYGAVITACNDDGTYGVVFEDGFEEAAMPSSKIMKVSDASDPVAVANADAALAAENAAKKLAIERAEAELAEKATEKAVTEKAAKKFAAEKALANENTADAALRLDVIKKAAAEKAAVSVVASPLVMPPVDTGEHRHEELEAARNAGRAEMEVMLEGVLNNMEAVMKDKEAAMLACSKETFRTL